MLKTSQEGKTPYQFTSIPSNLIYLLDNDCYKLISILIKENSYFTNFKLLDENGYFFLPTEKLSKFLFKKNRVDIKNIINTLVEHNLIFVNKKGKTNMFYFKLNIPKIIEYENMEHVTICNNQITVSKRNNKTNLLQNVTSDKKQLVTKCNKDLLQNVTSGAIELVTKCNTNIDTEDNKKNIKKEKTYVINTCKENAQNSDSFNRGKNIHVKTFIEDDTTSKLKLLNTFVSNLTKEDLIDYKFYMETTTDFYGLKNDIINKLSEALK